MSIVHKQGDHVIGVAHDAPLALTGDRRGVYYWKCDRASAFHNSGPHFRLGNADEIAATLTPVLNRRMNSRALVLRRANSPGNHFIYSADAEGTNYLIRVENGPERDDYMEVEAHVLDKVREVGLRTPQVYLADSSRSEVPFAYQVMQFLPFVDLNILYKSNSVQLHSVAHQIGKCVATWQCIRPPGYGPFNSIKFRAEGELVGLHQSYRDYYNLNLEKHLSFLASNEFLSLREVEILVGAIEAHGDLLNLSEGCLVHKDLALWNVLGTSDTVEAIIDWDDSIVGDPTDDLSLLACFHGGDVISEAVRGYQSVRPLPADFARRFWLHLLRNMIVKATIRIGAGYFERDTSFFLFPNGSSGNSLREFTHERLWAAYHGLLENRGIDSL